MFKMKVKNKLLRQVRIKHTSTNQSCSLITQHDKCKTRLIEITKTVL